MSFLLSLVLFLSDLGLTHAYELPYIRVDILYGLTNHITIRVMSSNFEIKIVDLYFLHDFKLVLRASSLIIWVSQVLASN